MLLTEFCPRRYLNPARGDLATVGGFRHKGDKYSRLSPRKGFVICTGDPKIHTGLPGVVAYKTVSPVSHTT